MVNIENVQGVWHILNRAKRPMTYGDVAKKLGYTDKRAGRILWRYLWIIGDYCVRRRQPPLNAIVVRQDIGEPGEGVLLREGRTVRGEIRAVLRGPSRLSTPTPEVIRKTWERLRKTL